MSKLFEPITLHGLTIRNRAWVSPMCQYSVEERDGVPTDWHLVHYGSLAIGGWGLVVAEATAVSPEGRISPWDTGLWSDEQVPAWRRVTDFVHSQGAAMGVQLAHAGRKGSTNKWWPSVEPGTVLPADGGWVPVGPTTAPGDSPELSREVAALDEAGVRKVVDDFVAAARRAQQAGFDVVEVHAAHGYLVHQFYSPLSNTRDDAWGGDFEGRVRLLLEVVDGVRAAFDGAVLVRISATDWDDEGWTVEDSVQLAGLLKEHGVDLVDVSTGGLVVRPIPAGPGYQVSFAEQVRAGAGIPTSAVGIITQPQQAEDLVADGVVDAVMLGREALRDVNWPLRAAQALGVPQEERPTRPQRGRAIFR